MKMPCSLLGGAQGAWSQASARGLLSFGGGGTASPIRVPAGSFTESESNEVSFPEISKAVLEEASFPQLNRTSCAAATFTAARARRGNTAAHSRAASVAPSIRD